MEKIDISYSGPLGKLAGTEQDVTKKEKANKESSGDLRGFKGKRFKVLRGKNMNAEGVVIDETGKSWRLQCESEVITVLKNLCVSC